MRHCPVFGQHQGRVASAGVWIRLKTKGFGDSVRLAWHVLMTFFVNATLDFVADVVEKIFAYVAPSMSFGLYAGAEVLFLYGLYMVFFGPQHGHP